MRKFVKAFQNLNNKTGGIYGFKKITTPNDISSMMNAFEDSGTVQVIKYSGKSAKVIKSGYESIKLRKRNNDTFLSKKQVMHYRNRKGANVFFYKKRNIYSINDCKFNGHQRFITKG